MTANLNQNRKKILYIVTHSEWAGAQVYVYNLAISLDQNKYAIMVAVGEKEVASRQSWLSDLKKRGLTVCYLKRMLRRINPVTDLQAVLEIYNLIKKTKPDIVHLNSSKAGVIGAIAAAAYNRLNNGKIKIIFTAHGFVFNEKLPWLLKKFYILCEKFAALFMDTIICVSEFDKISALNLHIANHRKFITIHNGIDLTKLNFLDRTEALNLLHHKVDSLLPDDFHIMTIANLYKTKGLEYLTKAAKIVNEKKPQAKFLVIGEGEERKRLTFLISKLKLEKNFFLISSLPQAYKYLSAADLFVLSSVKEGFPYTLLEALAAGTPIVATRVGGVVEIVEENVNGLLVPPADQQKLAQAIITLIDNKNLRSAFSQNNKKRAPRFALINCVSATEKVYLAD